MPAPKSRSCPRFDHSGVSVGHLLAERAAESHGPQRRVGDLDRIVEEELDAVALEEADGRIEALHETADHVVELARARASAPRARRCRRSSSSRAGRRRTSRPGGDGCAGSSRRPTRRPRRRAAARGSAAAAATVSSSPDLRLHPLLERAIQLGQLRRLRLDRVVVALDAEQRPDPGEQLVVVERLRDEVVGAGLDRLRLLLTDARRDHDHRQHRGVVVRAQLRQTA